MNKKALITGASGDLGQAIARQLADEGWYTYIHANKNLDKAQKIVNTILDQGGQAKAIQFDVTDSQACQYALEPLIEESPFQLIVNNAGIHDDATMAGMTETQWKEVIDISLNGFFNVTQPLLLPMIRSRWGRIINIASIAGVTGNRGQTNYAAAKAGLIGATKSLALELASRGITCNAIAPGIIQSQMTEDTFPKERIDTLVPMKRAGLPEEVAYAVAFLASEKAGYITRQVININGGMA